MPRALVPSPKGNDLALPKVPHSQPAPVPGVRLRTPEVAPLALACRSSTVWKPPWNRWAEDRPRVSAVMAPYTEKLAGVVLTLGSFVLLVLAKSGVVPQTMTGALGV